MKAIICPPFLGEIGCCIMRNIRWVHSLEADRKIVCTEKGFECLYPSASSFFHFVNPVEDSNRCGNGPRLNKLSYLPAIEAIYQQIWETYPGIEIVTPNFRDDTIDRQLEKVKFMPVAPKRLPAVDVVLSTRKRDLYPDKNWSHWNELASALRLEGFSIGIAGSASSSVPVLADAYAWNHPDGPMGGTVDLLSNCGLYVGQDTAPSHLAALMDVPMAVFCIGSGNHPDQTPRMQRVNRSYCRRLPDDYWNQPEKVIDDVLAIAKYRLRSCRTKERLAEMTI